MTKDQHDNMIEFVACSGVVSYCGHPKQEYLINVGNGRWKIAGDKSGKTYSYKAVTLTKQEYETGGM